MDVEASGLHFLVLNYQILSGKQLGKLGLDFVANGHGSNTYGPIIQKKEVRRPPHGQFRNWFTSVLFWQGNYQVLYFVV